MRLLFLRHAKAEPHGIRPDADRELVESGWKQVRRAARFCRDHTIVPDLILTSPLARARQTAGGFSEGVGGPPPQIVPWLAIGRAGREAMEELPAYREFGLVCLVGHEPDFSGLIAGLLGTSHSAIHVGKASLFCLDCVRPAPGRATLEFFLPNKLLAGA